VEGVVTCTADHNAIKADSMLWALLRSRGVQPGIPADPVHGLEAFPALELRDCHVCKSTLSVPMSGPHRCARPATCAWHRGDETPGSTPEREIDDVSTVDQCQRCLRAVTDCDCPKEGNES
jgi:hypothetical protein